MVDETPILYRPTTVANKLQISVKKVYELIKEGQLIAHSPNRTLRGIRISAESVREYIERTRISPERWLR